MNLDKVCIPLNIESHIENLFYEVYKQSERFIHHDSSSIYGASSSNTMYPQYEVHDPDAPYIFGAYSQPNVPYWTNHQVAPLDYTTPPPSPPLLRDFVHPTATVSSGIPQFQDFHQNKHAENLVQRKGSALPGPLMNHNSLKFKARDCSTAPQSQSSGLPHFADFLQSQQAENDENLAPQNGSSLSRILKNRNCLEFNARDRSATPVLNHFTADLLQNNYSSNWACLSKPTQVSVNTIHRQVSSARSLQDASVASQHLNLHEKRFQPMNSGQHINRKSSSRSSILKDRNSNDGRLCSVTSKPSDFLPDHSGRWNHHGQSFQGAVIHEQTANRKTSGCSILKDHNSDDARLCSTPVPSQPSDFRQDLSGRWNHHGKSFQVPVNQELTANRKTSSSCSILKDHNSDDARLCSTPLPSQPSDFLQDHAGHWNPSVYQNSSFMPKSLKNYNESKSEVSEERVHPTFPQSSDFHRSHTSLLNVHRKPARTLIRQVHLRTTSLKGLSHDHVGKKYGKGSVKAHVKSFLLKRHVRRHYEVKPFQCQLEGCVYNSPALSSFSNQR